jgi:hypothetical protein
MKTALFAFAASVLLAAPSWGGSSPYVLYNGRHVGGGNGGGAGRSISPPAHGGFSGFTGGGSVSRLRAFSGGGRFAAPASHGSSGYAFGPLRITHYVYRGIGIQAAASSGGSSGGSSSKAPPPNYSKPGALIRTAGQLPNYSKASGGGTHAVNGGGFIAANGGDSHDVGRSPGLAWGQPDTPPGTSPTAGGNNGAAYNGPPITVNNNTTDASHSNNTNGSQSGGNDNGRGNGKSGAAFPLSF